MSQGVIGLGTIQALCLLTFIRDPGESSWLGLGVAVRAAYQLGLHRHPSHALGKGETQAASLVSVFCSSKRRRHIERSKGSTADLDW